MKCLKSHLTFGGQTRFWEHESSATRTKMKFATFTPSRPTTGALIFLSGLTCTEENFIVKAGAQRALEDSGLMLICPDTSPRGTDLPGEHEAYDFGSGAGFYVDATAPGYRDHYRMYSYVTDELYAIAQNEFGAPRISLSGHSMGGHGALVMALREPTKFCSVSAFSPIVNPLVARWGKKAFAGYFGEANAEIAGAAYDATELVRSGRRFPGPMLIDQGTKDEFLGPQLMTQNFARACAEGGQELRLQMREGYDHSYYFISTFIEEHIAFHAEALFVRS